MAGHGCYSRVGCNGQCKWVELRRNPRVAGPIFQQEGSCPGLRIYQRKINPLKNKILVILFAVCFINSSCASGLIKVSYLDNYSGLIQEDIDLTNTNKNNLIQKMESLKASLDSYQQPLSADDYDKIINELTPIVSGIKKFKQSEAIFPKDKYALVLPAKSKVTLNLNTYCLSPHSAAPSSDEPYVLTSKTPDVPLYAEIMYFTNKNKVDRGLKQILIWNLKNDVKFEDLPLEQQKLLLEIDPASPLKINNFLKEAAKKQAEKLLEKYFPQIGKAKDIVDVVKGSVYKYEDYAKRVESLTSKYKKPSNDKPINAEGYGDIATIVQTSGYSKATVTFINTSGQPQEIHSYFKPLRKDVQPLGFDIPNQDELLGAVEQGFGELTADIIEKILKKYYKLDLKQGDRLSIEKNPERLLDLLKAFRNKGNAEARTIKEFGYSGTNDITDAFRHAYWNAIMARDLSDSFASEIANNHELNDRKLDENTMDMWNNHIGRDIGNKLKEQGIFDDDSYANEIIKNKEKLRILK
ncbi:MAG: hypothetical protein ABII27_07475 [bacterium]